MKSAMTYECYIKVFAGVYRKHAKNFRRSIFTCYVRNALLEYLDNPHSRSRLLEDCGGEDAVGYRIAKALIAQGFEDDAIQRYTDCMQDFADVAEGRNSDLSFCEQIEAIWGEPNNSLPHKGNSLRLHWMMHGAPELIEED